MTTAPLYPVGFKNTALKNNMHADGINFEPLENLYFQSAVWGLIRTTIGKGFHSDGLSIPRLFENIVERFGKLLFSGITHDGAYQDQLEQQQPDGSWARLTLAESQANNLIEECAKSQGGSELEIHTIYTALVFLGWRAFSEDRKAAAELNAASTASELSSATA